MSFKIAHVTATFPPYHGGTGVVCYHNALHLARRGHDVTVITAAATPTDDYADPPEITVQRLPVRYKMGNAVLLAGLWPALRGYDLVHLHYPFVFGQETLFVRRVPYVITYHQDIILDGLKGRMVRAHHRLIGQRILTGSRRLLVTSNDYAQSARIAPLLRRTATAEMPNGVDPGRFRPDTDTGDLRARYGLAPDDRVVLFVGGLDTPHYFKGVEVLLEAFAQIPGEDIKLLIVGDGDLRPYYMTEAERRGLGTRVVFCGRVSDRMLPAHYALCDLFVLPSTTMGEAFGVVLLEAMATAKPVIASNLPGVRSVVTQPEDGLLAAPGNAADLAAQMRELLEKPDLRAAMGQRGREKVLRKYAWEAITTRLETVYEEVLCHHH